MKKKLSIFLMAALMVFCFAIQAEAAEVVTTGDCGESATYTLYDDGHLVISGSGEIYIDPANATSYVWDFSISQNATSVTIEEGITSIGFNTFYGWPILEEVNLPATLTQIGEQAFGECSALTGILLPESLETIGDSAFYKAGITEIKIPDSVTTIGFQALYGTKLTSLVIPENVTSLGSNFAWACNDLKHFEIYCSGTYEMVTRTVETVIIGDNITAIEDNAFYGNQNLKSVTIGNGVTSIGEMAFQGCDITSLVIPDSVTSIGPYCFKDCPNLEEIVIGKGLVADFVTDDFSSSYNLKTVIIEGSSVTLGDSMFSCHPSLTKVILGDGVTSIGSNTFQDCETLTEVRLGNGLTQIGECAFVGCNNLTGSITIPGTVQVIPERTFEDTGFTEITLEEGIETISASAFLNVPLTSLEIPDSVTEIAADSFRMCKELTSITIGSGLKEIPDGAFFYLPKLTTLTLSEGLESIGAHAFDNDTALLEVVIPDSVTSIGECVFQDCSGIERLTIGSGVKYIDRGMFNGCTGVKEVTLKEGLETIGNAFVSMHNLSRIVIPASVKTVYCCSMSPFSASQMIFLGDMPDFGGGFLSGIESTGNAGIYYPIENPTWAVLKEDLEQQPFINDLIGYYVDENGKFIPESPTTQEIKTVIEEFKTDTMYGYPQGSSYPDNYRYIINGNYIEASGAEAFAFYFSDACAGYLPISEHRDVVYKDIQISDILYDGDNVWLITGKDENGVTVSGAVDEVVVHDRTLTKEEVLSADSYRTRYNVALQDYELYPYEHLVIKTDPDMPVNEALVYERIMALQDQYPHGMSWNEKNVYNSKYDVMVGRMKFPKECVACGAFEAILGETAFGDLEPLCKEYYGSIDYDAIMVGDSLIYSSVEGSSIYHIVVVTEVYSNYVVVAEGNLNEKIHWGRIMTRETVEEDCARISRYPEGTVAPKREYKEIPKQDEWIPGVTPGVPAFSDVPQSAYYAAPVAWAASKGITTGVSETAFAPDDTCTRAQIVTFLWRANGSPAPASNSNPFTDVPAGQWYTDAVLWAVENGITSGTSATTFSPDAGCTRGQVATFLWRAEDQPAPGGSNIFTDLVSGAYYYDAVLWAVENGVTNGMGDGTFAPDATCTRGQIVTFLYRAIA